MAQDKKTEKQLVKGRLLMDAIEELSIYRLRNLSRIMAGVITEEEVETATAILEKLNMDGE